MPSLGTKVSHGSSSDSSFPFEIIFLGVCFFGDDFLGVILFFFFGGSSSSESVGVASDSESVGSCWWNDESWSSSVGGSKYLLFSLLRDRGDFVGVDVRFCLVFGVEFVDFGVERVERGISMPDSDRQKWRNTHVECEMDVRHKIATT